VNGLETVLKFNIESSSIQPIPLTLDFSCTSIHKEQLKTKPLAAMPHNLRMLLLDSVFQETYGQKMQSSTYATSVQLDIGPHPNRQREI
jgi:hypothetical protein